MCSRAQALLNFNQLLIFIKNDCPCRDLNPGLPRYQAGMLPTVKSFQCYLSFKYIDRVCSIQKLLIFSKMFCSQKGRVVSYKGFKIIDHFIRPLNNGTIQSIPYCDFSSFYSVFPQWFNLAIWQQSKPSLSCFCFFNVASGGLYYLLSVNHGILPWYNMNRL